MEKWLESALASSIQAVDGGRYIVLSRWPSGQVQSAVPVATAAAILSSAGLAAPFTLAQASATALASEGGWQPIFDAWHAAGAI